MARPTVSFDFIHDRSVDTQKTNAVQVPGWARNAAVYIPALGTNCAVAMELIELADVTAALLLASNDTSWNEVRDADQDAQVAASGVEDCWIDITLLIQSLPAGCFIRFTLGSAQAADSSWVLVFRG